MVFALLLKHGAFAADNSNIFPNTAIFSANSTKYDFRIRSNSHLGIICLNCIKKVLGRGHCRDGYDFVVVAFGLCLVAGSKEVCPITFCAIVAGVEFQELAARDFYCCDSTLI